MPSSPDYGVSQCLSLLRSEKGCFPNRQSAHGTHQGIPPCRGAALPWAAGRSLRRRYRARCTRPAADAHGCHGLIACAFTLTEHQTQHAGFRHLRTRHLHRPGATQALVYSAPAATGDRIGPLSPAGVLSELRVSGLPSSFAGPAFLAQGNWGHRGSSAACTIMWPRNPVMRYTLKSADDQGQALASGPPIGHGNRTQSTADLKAPEMRARGSVVS